MRDMSKSPPKVVTVAELIDELKKLPPEAHVFTTVLAGRSGLLPILKPAHALLCVNGEVHILGQIK